MSSETSKLDAFMYEYSNAFSLFVRSKIALHNLWQLDSYPEPFIHPQHVLPVVIDYISARIFAIREGITVAVVLCNDPVVKTLL